jgi:protein-S-isoprenylcysteine O-methyltransferase Ste14
MAATHAHQSRVRVVLERWNARGEVFVVVQFVLLALIFWFPDFNSNLINPSFVFPGRVLRWLGVIVLILAGLNLGRNLTPLPKPKTDSVLVTTGLFALVRHPIYSALLLLSFGSALERQHVLALIFSLCLAVLLELKSIREERWLLEKFADYSAYQKRVKKFIPWIY